jgi:hypothetical protein
MANEFVARNGVIALSNSIVTGSLTVTSGITGSHFGTSSWAQNSLTASYFITSSVTSASYSVSSSYSTTASVLLGSVTSASYAATSSNILGGAVNYIPFFIGSTNLSSSVIYQTAGNIGINITNPTYDFQVVGSGSVVNFRGSGSVASSSIFTVDGAAGRLFSVNDSLSGSLFSVNTIAGLPVIEAFSDNTIRIGQYGQKALYVSQSRVGVGIENPTAKLHISASTGVLFEIDTSGSANTFYVSSSGRISVGRTDPGGRFDIAYAGALNDPTILLGADDTATTTRTDNTTKLTRIAVAHYSNSATSSAILAASSTATSNTLFIGGGSAYMNTANSIQFYIGATTASLTGTEILRLSGSGEIIITGSTIITGSLSVSQSIIGFGSNTFGSIVSSSIHRFTGSLNITGSTSITGSINISGSTSTNHIIGNTSVPTVAAGTGAGTGPTIGVFGSDLAGSLRIKTGTSPAALAPIGTVTFSATYATAPHVIFAPTNTSSAALTGTFGVYVTSSTTGFTLFSNLSALTAATQCSWSYHVIQ